jgi:hypothetical protein
MAKRFGGRATFAVEVGQLQPSDLRIVDLWAAGTLLTTNDNTAYVPSFSPSLRSSAARVRRREARPCPFPERSPEQNFQRLHADQTGFREQYWFMHWGETVDNVSAYAYLNGDLVIVFTFQRIQQPFLENCGQVFVARIPPQEFVDTLEAAADFLDVRADR